MKRFFVRSIVLIFIGIPIGSCKKAAEPAAANSMPLVNLAASMTNANTFSFSFTANASDADNDPLKFIWDFGDGTVKEGGSTITFSFPANREYVVKVSVTDGKSSPVQATVNINTNVTAVTINSYSPHQTMTGFGGFGAQDVPWSAGPYTSPEFINRLTDLGVSVLRDEVPTNFEYINDNADPFVTDLSKYNLNTMTSGQHNPLGTRLQFFKDAKAAGITTFIATVWSPPTWMKTNNRIDNGTSANAAPPYNQSPSATDNQLRVDMYNEFAEMCVAYVKILKQQTGIELYAFSIQNEPRFSQMYQSCIYNGAAMRDLLKVTGKRFKDEGLTTKLFIPEDVGYLDGVSGMVTPSLSDRDARQYADIVAVHGYALDGITANSPDAQTWQTMFGWGAQYGKPLWMTETSGYKNDWSGALALSKAMYTALKFGNVSAWLFWTLSSSTLDEYSLMSSSGAKSSRYYTSKNYYRWIRPGAIRIDADAVAGSKIYPLAFMHAANKETTMVLINDNTQPMVIKLGGTVLPATFNQFNTTATDNCIDAGVINSADNILLPAGSVVTLYKKE
ncbi:MAG: PKD domain-containing protein [Chitinophagaceae bacterium]